MDKKYYQEALDVQSACNGMGVIRSLGEIVEKIEEDYKLEASTVRRPTHPVLVMYADKLADLCEARWERPSELESLNIAKVMVIVRDHLIKEKVCEGTLAFNTHPLIHTLAYLLYKETGASDLNSINKAYDECEKISKEV